MGPAECDMPSALLAMSSRAPFKQHFKAAISTLCSTEHQCFYKMLKQTPKGTTKESRGGGQLNLGLGLSPLKIQSISIKMFGGLQQKELFHWDAASGLEVCHSLRLASGK